MAEVRKIESILRDYAERFRLSNLEKGITRFPPPPPPRSAPPAHPRPAGRPNKFGEAPPLNAEDMRELLSLQVGPPPRTPPRAHPRAAPRADQFGELQLTPHDLNRLPPEYVYEWLKTGQFNLFTDLSDLDHLPHETLKVLLDADPELADRYFEHNLRQSISSADYSRRLLISLSLAAKHLEDEEVKKQFLELFSAENIAITSSVLAVWALSHLFGVGEVIDAILLAATVATTAYEIEAIADAMWDYFELSQTATSYEDLDEAGKKMAFVITKVGITAILALILKGGSRRSPGMPRAMPAAAAAMPKGRGVPVLTSEQVLKRDWKAHSKAAQKIGMTDGALARIQRITTADGVRVTFRGAGRARGERLLGGSPKIEKLKMNTITPDDVDIGAPSEGLGHVGFFQPKEPSLTIRHSNPRRYDQLKARYEQRKQQYQEWSRDVQELIAAGEIELRNGVIYDPKTSRPFAGDYDLYEITTIDGRRLGPGDPLYERVMGKLKGETIDVQHGPHLNWNPTTPSGQTIKNRIIHRHRYEEPVYQFREDGTILEVFAD
jgi:hypothetical protein